MRAAATERARELFRAFATRPEEDWTGVRAIHAEKVRARIRLASEAYGLSPVEVVERVAAIAERRAARRPPPIYVTGLGGSGSNWLAEMLGDLDGCAWAGEVYLPPSLLRRLRELPIHEQGFLVDALHLLHAWPRRPEIERARIVNSASRLYKRPEVRRWDPRCAVVYLVRDPRDQVLSVTFRKPAYRARTAPGVDDREYLASRAASNRATWRAHKDGVIAADAELRYEELRGDTRGVLEGLLPRIGLAAGEEAIEAVIYAHDAHNIRAGVVPRTGNIDEGGRSRGWREDAGEDVKRVLHAELAEVVLDLGYEPDDCLGRPVLGPPIERGRTLRFPERASLGTTFLRDRRGDPPAWRPAGLARGAFEAPAGHDVRLRLDEDVEPAALLARDLGADAVQSLCLAGHRGVRDQDLGALRALAGLRELDLARTRVTDEAVPALARLGDLLGLSLYGTEVTEAGAARLRSALPRAEIHR